MNNALPSSTAVLVVDMQNDTVGAQGAYASFGAADHATSQNVVANIRSILDAARSGGVPVFHSRIVVCPLAGVGGSNAPVFRMLAPDTFKIGSWGAEIIDEVKPATNEIVLNRTRMSVFNGTEIDALLRNLGVRSLIVVGAWTNMAVEHTVRDGADHGYDVTIVSDATSSLSEDWQRGALEYALTNIASIVSTTTLLSQLQPQE